VIVFFDDEPHFVHYYLKELRTAYGVDRVVFRDNLNEAQQDLDANGDQVEAMVLDIMMPPRSEWSPGDAEGGLNSGIKFLEDNLALLRKSKIPVVILTNRDVNRIEGALDALRDYLYKIEVHQKTQTPAWHLPTIVHRLLAAK